MVSPGRAAWQDTRQRFSSLDHQQRLPGTRNIVEQREAMGLELRNGDRLHLTTYYDHFDNRRKYPLCPSLIPTRPRRRCAGVSCWRAMAERMGYLLQVTDCSKPGLKTLEQIPSSSPGIAPTRGEDCLTVRTQFVAPVLAVERPPNVVIVSGDQAIRTLNHRDNRGGNCNRIAQYPFAAYAGGDWSMRRAPIGSGVQFTEPSRLVMCFIRGESVHGRRRIPLLQVA